MTEEQINDGYERLDSAIVAPGDAVERVNARMRARRRARQAAVIGGTSLAVVVAAGAYAALGAGDSHDGRKGSVAVDPPPATLNLTRPDGSTYAFENITVSCRPPVPFGEEAPTGDGTIYMNSPIDIQGEKLGQPFVLFQGTVDKIVGKTFSLPVDGPGDSDSYPFTLFIADTEGGPDGNELASSAGGSTGTVTITEAACLPKPVLTMDIDATLGSEETLAGGEMKQSSKVSGRLE